MNDKELGPCPLCGGEPKPSGFDYDREQKYFSCICGLDVPMSVWNRLSALAEQNRRRGEALERCCETLSRIAFDCGAGWIATEAEEAIEICNEALKSSLVGR